MGNNVQLLSVDNSQVTREYFTPNPAHRHDKWELLIFEKGISDNFVNETKFTATEGDVFLLGPPHLHEIRFIATPHLHRDLYYTSQILQKICDNYSKDLFGKLQDTSYVLHLHLDASMRDTIDLLCRNLDTLCLARSAYSDSDFQPIDGLSQSILNIIVGIYFSQHIIKKIDAPPILLDILKKLHLPKYFTQNTSAIVAQTNYSHSQFLKIFKQYTGMTIAKYLNRVRIEYAAELLRNTDKTALSICEECGYNSLSFFIKSFKEKYGQTPLMYRKTQHQKIV